MALRLRSAGIAATHLAFGLVVAVPAFAEQHTLTVTEGTNFSLAVGPDGSAVIDLQGMLWRLPGGEAGKPAKRLLLRTRANASSDDDRLPRFSADGRTVVFQSFRTGSFDIWSVPASGGEATPLTSGPADDREPAWYPDGRRIAFSSDRSGNLDIWRLDIGSRELAPLTSDAADDYWPAVSPDGQHLAFVSDRSGLPAVYVQALAEAGSPARIVAGDKTGRASAPSWSPDGGALAYIQTREQIGFPSMARHIVTLVELGTGATREVSAAGADVFPFPPAWLPDGSLAYTADGVIRLWRTDGTHGTLPFAVTLPVSVPAWRHKRFQPVEKKQVALGILEPVAAPDGGVVFAALGDLWWRTADGDLRQLTDDAALERDPAFSPDGRTLAFISDRDGTMQVWLRNLAAGTDRVLTAQPRGPRYPTFSPDGRWLAFQQAGPRGNQDFTLHRVEIGSGAVTKLRAPPLWPGRMGFSADGRRLLLAVLTSQSARYRDGRNVLLAIDVATGEAATVDLPPGQAPDAGPALAPDGRTAALVVDGELWVLPLRGDGTAGLPPQRLAGGLVDYPSFSFDGKTLTYLTTRGLRQITARGGPPEPLPVSLTWRPATGTGSVLIRAGRLFDGTGPDYMRNVDVLVTGNRITEMGPDLVAPPGAMLIDARHATVMPGLIDNHAHHQAHDGGWVGRAWLAFGVTSVVEPGGLPYESREQFESWSSGRRAGPRLFYAGPQLDGKRRFFPFASHITSERRLALELDRATALDYSLLKTYTRLPVSRQALAIRGAHRIGLPVSSHEIYPALALGGDRVEHLRGTSRLGWSGKQSDAMRMYGDAVQIIGGSGATIVPTMVVGGSFLDFLLKNPDIDELPQYAAFYSATDRRALRALAGVASRRRELFDTGLENSRRSVRDLAAAGARILAGTDAPIFPYGLSLLAELRSLRDAGLPAADVLQAATGAAAAALGADDQLGRLAPGLLADLLIVDGDPLADPLDLARLETVISNGVVWTPEQLRAVAGPGVAASGLAEAQHELVGQHVLHVGRKERLHPVIGRVP
jgi:Tol biopolymer transport system component